MAQLEYAAALAPFDPDILYTAGNAQVHRLSPPLPLLPPLTLHLRLQLKLGQLRQAAALYSKAVDAEPMCARAWNNLAISQ